MNDSPLQFFSLAAFAVALLGPDYGPAVAILFAAMAGAVWGLASVPTAGRLAGAGLFIRFTITACVLVGGGTALAHEYLSVKWSSPVDLSVLVAFVIAAVGNRWGDILARLDPSKLLARGPRGNDR